MWKTVLALLVTIVVIPFIAFRFDDALTVLQSSTLMKVVIVYLAGIIRGFTGFGSALLTALSEET